MVVKRGNGPRQSAQIYVLPGRFGMMFNGVGYMWIKAAQIPDFCTAHEPNITRQLAAEIEGEQKKVPAFFATGQ